MIVLHEAFGLNDDIRRITSRFASNGYVAVAPDLYSYGRRPLCLARTLLALAGAGTEDVLKRIDAVHEYLATREDVDADRIGVVGFCMGGGFALLFSTRGKASAAGVNYGAVPRSPQRLVGACPIVASYGAEDRVLAPHASRLESHLRVLGIPHDVHLYPNVGHSFLSWDNEPAWVTRIPFPNPTRAGYDEEAAEDAWARMLAFFGEHLARRP